MVKGTSKLGKGKKKNPPNKQNQAFRTMNTMRSHEEIVLEEDDDLASLAAATAFGMAISESVSSDYSGGSPEYGEGDGGLFGGAGASGDFGGD